MRGDDAEDVLPELRWGTGRAAAAGGGEARAVSGVGDAGCGGVRGAGVLGQSSRRLTGLEPEPFVLKKEAKAFALVARAVDILLAGLDPAIHAVIAGFRA
jgi:hypothetical protein